MSADFKILRPHVAKLHSAKQASASSRCEWSQPTCQLRPCQQQKRTGWYKFVSRSIMIIKSGENLPLPFLAESRHEARGKAGEPLWPWCWVPQGRQPRPAAEAAGTCCWLPVRTPCTSSAPTSSSELSTWTWGNQLWPKGRTGHPIKVRTGNSPLTPEESHGGSGPGLALSHSPSLDGGKTWKNYFSHLTIWFSYQN